MNLDIKQADLCEGIEGKRMMSFQQHNMYKQLKSANRSQALKFFKEAEFSLWSQVDLGSNSSSAHLPGSFALILYILPLFLILRKFIWNKGIVRAPSSGVVLGLK